MSKKQTATREHKIKRDFPQSLDLILWVSFGAYLFTVLIFALSLFGQTFLSLQYVQSIPTTSALLAAFFAFFQNWLMRKQIQLQLKKPEIEDEIKILIPSRQPLSNNTVLPTDTVWVEFIISNRSNIVTKYPAIQLRFSKQDIMDLIDIPSQSFKVDEVGEWMLESHGNQIYPSFGWGIPITLAVYRNINTTKITATFVAENIDEPLHFTGEVNLCAGINIREGRSLFRISPQI